MLCDGIAITGKNKSSAVATMGDHGQNRHGPKRGGFCSPFTGWGAHYHITVGITTVWFTYTVTPKNAPLNYSLNFLNS